MEQTLAESSLLAIDTSDGARVNVQHLAGRTGPVILVLPANGFPIKCYTPIVSHS